MIVTLSNFKESLEKFEEPNFYSLDTETTGLRWWDKDRLFSIILSDDKEAFYFNFNANPDHLGNFAPKETVLPREYLSKFKKVLGNKESTWFMHNAKFDMGMIAREGLSVDGRIHCTESIARLLDPEHFSYTLDLSVKRMNEQGRKDYKDVWIDAQKDNTVEAYISKHKLYTTKKLPWAAKEWLDMRYDLVPFEIMSRYGENDAVITYRLGQFQRYYLNRKTLVKDKQFINVIKQERALTPVLFDMEQSGFRLDKKRTEELIQADQKIVDENIKAYKDLIGEDFIDSGKVLAEVFTKLKIEYPKTEKGNPSINKGFLKDLEHPLGNIILNIRTSSKRINSYYLNFLHYQSSETGKIHASILQGGTTTGRMSIRSPALQTVPKMSVDIDDDQDDTETGATVRSCFIPDEGCFLFSPDYDQMEYRLMVDQAGEIELIEKIKNGLDVHTATAELIKQPRKVAKTINFLLLYGGGVKKLAEAINITESKARELMQSYFASLPKVTMWKKKTILDVKQSGWGKNWFGRIFELTPKWSYKAPNYAIQGGSADGVKTAMLRISELLKPYKSKMCLQIHDEVVFNIRFEEAHLQEKIVDILEKAYPHKHLKLSAGPGYSTTHWGVKKDGYYRGGV